MYILSILLIFLIFPATTDVSGPFRVIDGDTLEIDGTRIRLHGIDAPETRQTCQRDEIDWLCGQEASKALRDYVGGADLRCERLDTDRYGRMVAKCFTPNGNDIGEWMVRNGWALAYQQYSKDYVGKEAEAKAAERGLWAGEFVEPWNWRRGD